MIPIHDPDGDESAARPSPLTTARFDPPLLPRSIYRSSTRRFWILIPFRARFAGKRLRSLPRDGKVYRFHAYDFTRFLRPRCSNLCSRFHEFYYLRAAKTRLHKSCVSTLRARIRVTRYDARSRYKLKNGEEG